MKSFTRFVVLSAFTVALLLHGTPANGLSQSYFATELFDIRCTAGLGFTVKLHVGLLETITARYQTYSEDYKGGSFNGTYSDPISPVPYHWMLRSLTSPHTALYREIMMAFDRSGRLISWHRFVIDCRTHTASGDYFIVAGSYSGTIRVTW